MEGLGDGLLEAIAHWYDADDALRSWTREHFPGPHDPVSVVDHAATWSDEEFDHYQRLREAEESAWRALLVAVRED